MEVWANVYAMELEVEVEWMDDVSAENPVLLAGQYSVVRIVPLPDRCQEIQSIGYIQDLIALDP